ncbi:MAG TPA: ABC transporter permease [Vicinamibacterales bacterium]|nr:ABC transporter permease [Vicinamibacterales bacterium]
MFESFVSDIRFALRWLVKSPGFTVVAVVSLAIGIGFNTTLFTVADVLLFRPLPVSAPDRLVDIFTSDSTGSVQYGTSSYPDYVDLRAHNNVFSDLVGYSPMFAAVNLDSGSRLVMGEIVTGNYFDVLGVGAAVGRTIAASDDRPGAPRVVMVSNRYWSRELGGTADALGRTIRIRGNPYTIVGVVPERFTGMVPMLAPDLWVPVASSLETDPVGMHDAIPSPTGTNRLERRGDRWMFMRGRLKPGKTLDDARANLGVLMSQLGAAYPDTNKSRRVSALATRSVHLHPDADAKILPIAVGLLAVVGLVLLIACANVASMLLARASGRQKEIGIRLAIGASRARLIRQLITEAIVMSAIGAVAGVLLAWWATRLLMTIHLPTPLPLAFDLRLDSRVFAFTIFVTLVAGVVAGIAPAIQASKPDLVADLRGEQTAPIASRRWTLRDLLVAGQIAVTSVLLIVAVLLTRSLVAAQRTNVGFAVDRLALLSMDTSQLRYSADRSRQFYEQAMSRIGALPGVESVGLATRVPFSVNVNRWEIWIPGRHEIGAHGDTIEVTTVSPEYFKTIGIPIVAGRNFTYDDRPETPRVAIVNETFARRYWPNESAIGKTIRSRGADGPAFEIVGVVADHKVLTIGEPPTPFLHVARTQRPNPYSVVLARTRGDANTLLRDMRRELLAMEPNLVFVENGTMAAEVATTLFPVRASAWLVASVGAVAMLLAAIGLYGVIAYSVARRTREIGIRIALGARPGSVVRLVMRQGLSVALAGLAAGAVISAAVAVAVSRALYGVGPADPVSWMAAAGIVLAVSSIANLVPAWRAARVDPSIALRTE